MDIKALENVGLKSNEAKIYITLLENGVSLVSDIYKKTSIHRRNIYDALERLIEKGLVTFVIKNGKRYFQAINPERLIVYLKEKEEGINNILPELKEKYNSKKDDVEAQIFKGIEGMKTIMDDMLKIKQPMYLIGAKGKWLVDELRFYFPKFERERIKKRIKIKQIFDYEMRSKKIPNIIYSEHKFLPKEYSSPTHIWIYGNRVVTLFWQDTQFAFMIKSNKIAYGYKKYFEFIWRSLAKN